MAVGSDQGSGGGSTLKLESQRRHHHRHIGRLLRKGQEHVLHLFVECIGAVAGLGVAVDALPRTTRAQLLQKIEVVAAGKSDGMHHDWDAALLSKGCELLQSLVQVGLARVVAVRHEHNADFVDTAHSRGLGLNELEHSSKVGGVGGGGAGNGLLIARGPQVQLGGAVAVRQHVQRQLLGKRLLANVAQRVLHLNPRPARHAPRRVGHHNRVHLELLLHALLQRKAHREQALLAALALKVDASLHGSNGETEKWLVRGSRREKREPRAVPIGRNQISSDRCNRDRSPPEIGMLRVSRGCVMSGSAGRRRNQRERRRARTKRKICGTKRKFARMSFLFSSKKKPPTDEQHPLESTVEMPAEQPLNVFTEVQIFQSHTDIVTLLVKIDMNRAASSSHDKTICIWHVRDGKKLFTLQGHSLPITCLVVSRSAEALRLASASSDKTVRLWNVDSGECIQRIGTGDSIKCLIELPGGLLCGAGQNIHVWDRGGNLRAKLNRNEEEWSDVRCTAAVSSDIVVAVSDAKVLEPFSLQMNSTREVCDMYKLPLLEGHRETVCCITSISNELFATGSVDGCVLVWSSPACVVLHRLNELDESVYYSKQLHAFQYRIGALYVWEHILIAATGHGFKVFNLRTGSTVMDIPGAHALPITVVAVFDESRVIVTAADDGSIRLWHTPPLGFDDEDEPSEGEDSLLTPRPTSHSLFEPRDRASSQPLEQDSKSMLSETSAATTSSTTANASNSGRATPKAVPRSNFSFDSLLGLRKKDKETSAAPCFGEMLLHSDAVHGLLVFDNDKFMSCSSDKLILLWKTGSVESARRSNIAGYMLKQFLGVIP
eukprot:m.243709 g.243709  ORF g.243709 m.243709 type:complete len:832 (-) comp22552_c0_seq3:39-2534(-)